HGEARAERGMRTPRDAFVGLAEVLTPLRMADERAAHAERLQHRRRDLAGVGALGLPVDVLRERRQPRGDAVGEPRVGRTDDRLNAVDVAQPVCELGRVRARIHLPVAGDDHAGITATPGSSFPSSSSRLAPPPVETHEIRSASPSSLTARTESAPPTTENASPFAATASATAFVPAAKRGHSNTPIGPFQKIVRASPIRFANSLRVSGPMSSPSHPSGSSSFATTRESASASNSEAATTSLGSSTSNESRFSTRSSSAILPPISTTS